MSTNTRALQKRAAFLFMEGKHLEIVSKELGVRPDTIGRWRQSPYFLKALARLKANHKQDFELRTIRMTEKITYLVEYGLDRHSAANSEMYEMLDMLKNVRNLGMLPPDTPQNQLKPVKKQPKSVKPDAESAPTSTE